MLFNMGNRLCYIRHFFTHFYQKLTNFTRNWQVSCTIRPPFVKVKRRYPRFVPQSEAFTVILVDKSALTLQFDQLPVQFEQLGPVDSDTTTYRASMYYSLGIAPSTAASVIKNVS